MEVFHLRVGKGGRNNTEDAEKNTEDPEKNYARYRKLPFSRCRFTSRHASQWNFIGIFVKMCAVCQTICRLLCDGRVAQLGERIHGMDEVAGSIPVTSTNFPIPPSPQQSGGQVRLRACGKMASSFCHSERSEESLFFFLRLNRREISRFARNDKIDYFFRSLLSQITCLRSPDLP
jgi:hypothetical protein